ncbi:MAG: hypothetical protein HGB11_03930 [Chlorobiales bacterium]|nr:hypothetical protein [Chlorobiales bacterium]
MKACLKLTGLFLALTVIGSVIWAVWFGYLYHPFFQTIDQKNDTGCSDIPKGSVAFALGFIDNGRDGEKIIPGDANIALATYLDRHSHCFSMILTQRAILVALAERKGNDPDMVSDSAVIDLNGTPVYQMHQHDPKVLVRTYETLRYALDRLSFRPKHIVLIAHDKQYDRAFDDLSVMYPKQQIINPQIGEVPYQNPDKINAFIWALREFYLAIPADFITRKLTRYYPEIEIPEMIPEGR